MYENRNAWKLRGRVLIPLSCALVFGLSILSFGQTATSGAETSTCVSPTGQTVSLLVKFPDGSSLSIPKVPWIQNMNVHLAMNNAQNVNSNLTYDTSYFCPYGAYVTEINGWVESGSSYWELSVNGSVSNFGIDTAVLSAGDSILWQVQTVAQPKQSFVEAEAKAKWVAGKGKSVQAMLFEKRNHRRLSSTGGSGS